jgi:predicted MFS family arabinose efflux permease
MQNIGQSWLVLELTHSALKLSLVTMMQFIPMMLFSLYAGTLADRLSKRNLLIFTQSSLAVLAAVLATLTYFDVIKYWHIMILAFLLGIVNTLDVPVRQAFVVELVGKDDLPNAIALNSSIFNLGRVAGPAVSGLLIGLFGIAVCFYLNAVSFIAVITNLCMIRLPKSQIKNSEFRSPKDIYVDIREGLRYINQREIIKQPLLLLALTSTFVMNFNILVPVFAQQELNQNATGYGLLMTCMGIGSFLGALTLVAKSKYDPKLRYLVGGAAGMSAFLAVLSTERNFILACITLFFVGFCTILFTTLVNTTIQLNSSDEMRGRVMSVYTLVFGGVIPIGSLYTGQLTESVGAPGCMVVSGILGILAVLWSAAAMRKGKKQ